MIQHITGKLGNMRKSVEWVVYPQKPEEPHIFLIQSDKRIAKIDVNAKNALLNSGKHGNSFLSLTPQLGATVVPVPGEMVDALKSCGGKNNSTAVRVI